MRITEEQLKNDLVECYTFYFRQARRFYDQEDMSEDELYLCVKADGAVEALNAIMLQVFGGKEFGEIWSMTLNWLDAQEEDSNDHI